MLDLNIDIFPRNPAYRGAKTASGTYQATDLPGVSNSSAVNFADSENSNSSALNLDFSRKLRTIADLVPDNDDEDDGDEVVDAGNDRPGFVTWQLFPEKGGGGGGGGLSCESDFRVGSSETQWLNLSVSGSGSGGSSAMEQSTMTVPPQQPQVRRSRRGPRSRSSQYRGVTFYRRTGRWESHIWDCGKQVYLGGFDTAFAAARAYDRAAIKFRGVEADINFGVTDYKEDMKQMKDLNKEEFVQALRRQSAGFSRGSSRYRGATLHKCGRLEPPIGHYLGNKASDKAAIQYSGREAVTDFERGNYEMNMPLEVNREVGHNLDLNLGISISVERPQGSKKVQIYPRPALYYAADRHTTMVGSSYGPPSGHALYGQSSSSNQSAIWHGSPVVSAVHAEGAIQEKQLDSVPSSASSNWAWNMQARRHGGANQVVPLYPSSAASSGFSF